MQPTAPPPSVPHPHAPPPELPSWVWLGGMFLAFIAGIVNAVGFLGVQHEAITHVTGTTTLWSIAAANGNTSQAVHLAAIVGSFLAGAVLSGIIIQDLTLRLGRRYGVALMVESALLTGAVIALRRGSNVGDYMASMAFGLQNALATTFSGAILRTTHMTGIITDLGIAIGHALRRRPVNLIRVRLCIALFGGFFAGGVAGAFAFAHYGTDTLLGPACLTAIAALTYRTFGLHQRA